MQTAFSRVLNIASTAALKEHTKIKRTLAYRVIKIAGHVLANMITTVNLALGERRKILQVLKRIPNTVLIIALSVFFKTNRIFANVINIV